MSNDPKPHWLTQKVLGTVVAFIAVTVLTASAATYDKARTNKVGLKTASDAVQMHGERLKLLEDNQRLIICQMKEKDGRPCNPMDLLKTK